MAERYAIQDFVEPRPVVLDDGADRARDLWVRRGRLRSGCRRRFAVPRERNLHGALYFPACEEHPRY